ncbi:MAG: hypothetical protein PHQ93_05800 [Sulfurimonas sp.]|uniref:hypothetical protein n=1 Tax=Sulfurimonas sp. TaxID=2022749 RepID=UPI002603FD0E|nr:hypothetical protein [Sulfurimonas sp.]MDD5400678.1 hypothetical protein [Sulfurimonas sp.]
MRKVILFWLFLSFCTSLFGLETIVFVRHGEKPSGGLGQINCQGLNRALRLPDVLEQKFGKPTAVFASNPAKQKKDSGVLYDYIRPLATIEPTAIRYGLPVNVQFGFLEVAPLVAELKESKFNDATIFVAWEHHLIVEIVKSIVPEGITVPAWENGDFDSIYVVQIDTNKNSYKFWVEKQGLNDMPTQCEKAKLD